MGNTEVEIKKIIEEETPKLSKGFLLMQEVNLLHSLISKEEIKDILHLRELFTDECSWVMPTSKNLKIIGDALKFTGFNSVIDAGNGTGVVGRWLNKLYGTETVGCNINNYPLDRGEERDILDLLSEYNSLDKVILLSWPPYKDSMANDVWEAMLPGQYMVYIGEGVGGCNADKSFFDSIKGCEVAFTSDDIDRWPYINDGLILLNKDLN